MNDKSIGKVLDTAYLVTLGGFGLCWLVGAGLFIYVLIKYGTLPPPTDIVALAIVSCMVAIVFGILYGCGAWLCLGVSRLVMVKQGKK